VTGVTAVCGRAHHHGYWFGKVPAQEREVTMTMPPCPTSVARTIIAAFLVWIAAMASMAAGG
jgi:hypothetical protein